MYEDEQTSPIPVPELTPVPYETPTPEEPDIEEPEPVESTPVSAATPAPEVTPVPDTQELYTTKPSNPDGFPVKNFELEAFDILKSAPSYNDGVNKLVKAYEGRNYDSPAEAEKILGQYTEDLSHRFKQPLIDPYSLVEMLPFKPNQAKATDDTGIINEWEAEGKKYISSSNDPDIIAMRPTLLRAIDAHASSARREQTEDRGNDSVSGWWKDQGARLLDSAVGPFAKLIGADETVKWLEEHTQPSRDKDVMSVVSGTLGAIAPVVVAGAVGKSPAVYATMALQGAGEARYMYKQSLAATGDEDKALQSAALVGGAMALGMLPVGRAANGMMGFITKQSVARVAKEGAEKSLSEAMLQGLIAQRKSWGVVAGETLMAGTTGTLGSAVQRAGQNIGLDRDGNIWEGAGEAFLVNAATAGFFSGGEALLTNAAVTQAQRQLRKVDDILKGKVVGEIKPEEKGAIEKKIDEAKIAAEKPLAESDDPLADRSVTLAPDGTIKWDNEPPKTVEERIQAQERLKEEHEAWVNDNPDPESRNFTDDTGARVDFPTAPNMESESLPQFLIQDPSIPYKVPWSGRAISKLISILGADVKLQTSVLDGAFGAFTPGKKLITILRSLGADPDKFNDTLTHEAMHLLDGVLNGAFKSKTAQTFVEKMKLIKNAVYEGETPAELWESAKQVSQDWRPGWDKAETSGPGVPPGWNEYRAHPAEVYADVANALMMSEKWLETYHPALKKLVENRILQNPETADFYKFYRELDADPSKLLNFHMQIMREGKLAGVKKSVEGKLIENRKNTEKRQFINLMKNASQWAFEKKAKLKEIASKQVGDVRNKAFEYYLDVMNAPRASFFISDRIDRPIQQWAKSIEEAKLDIGTIDYALYLNNIIKGETPTMVRIRDNFPVYQEAAQLIKQELAQVKGVKEGLFRGVNWDADTPDALSDALATIGVVTDTAEHLSLNDFINRYRNDNPKRIELGTAEYNAAVKRLERNKIHPARVELVKRVDSVKGADPEVLKAAQDLLSPNAFSVRKYLVNPGGFNRYNAEGDLMQLRHELGADKYMKLDKLVGQFHEIASSPEARAYIRQSQIFTDDLMQRVDINSDNYVTALVLKHFQTDADIDGSVKRAVGNLSEIGSESAATLLKQKAILRRAIAQKAENGVVGLARLGGEKLEEVKVPYGQSVWKEQVALSAKDSTASYIVEMEKGKAKLYRIEPVSGDGKLYENMTKSLSSIPVANVLAWIPDVFNKLFLTRQLKTVFNPRFVFGQKFMDRRIESIVTGSFMPTLARMFKRTDYDKASLAELRDAQSGKLHSDAKKLYDNMSLLLDTHTYELDGKDFRNTAEEAVYRLYGHDVPDERSIIDKIGEWNEEKINKLPFFKHLKTIAEFDENRSKLNGYKIGKDFFSMGDAEAAVWARENHGVPEGGGIVGPQINRLFLFGTAHLNGLRSMARIANKMPLNMTFQMGYRVIAPKLFWSPLIIAPALRYLYSDEEAKKYEKLYNMIPSNEWTSKVVIPFGFQDQNGKYRNFFDVMHSDEINSDWKAWYGRLPQTRNETTALKALWPSMTELFHGNIEQAFYKGTSNSADQLNASLQPAIQYAWNVIQLVGGKNPTDFFRQKGILTKETQEGGNVFERFGEFGKYVLHSQAPQIGPYNPYKTSSEAESSLEKTIGVPGIGPALGGFVGVSNYGNMETEKDLAAAKVRLNADILRSTLPVTRDVMQQYKRAAGKLSSLSKAYGKEWEAQVSPATLVKIKVLTSWQAKVWQPIKTELEAAHARGDTERYQYYLELLEDAAKQLLPSIDGAASESAFEKPKEDSK